MRAALLLGLAFRNLTRHKRRTIITAASLAVGLSLFILFDSLLTGFEINGVRNLVRYETGGLQLQHRDWWRDKDLLRLDLGLADPASLVGRLEREGLAASPRIVFSAEMVLNQDPWPESGSIQLRCVAMDPTRDRQVFQLMDAPIEGRWFEAGEEGAVIGSQMAKDLGARIGYPLTLVTRTRDGAFQTIDLVISGIVTTPNTSVNRKNLYLPLDLADSCLQMDGSVNQIAVRFDEELDDRAKAADLEARIKEIAPAATVRGWHETGAEFLAFVEGRQGLTRVILLLVFIIAAVGVSNTMLLTVLERTRENGMLRAQGLHDGELKACMYLEAGAIGLIGGLMGLALSVPGNLYLIHVGIDTSGLLEQVGADQPLANVLRGTWHPPVMLAALACGVILSVLVSILPVRRALAMQITDCLRAK
jgi:ABC-type lipoprotein release transport system permease subunit